jgi:DNA primase
MFPILDASSNSVGFGGRLLGPGEPKYLNSAESPVYSKSKLLYGLNMAKHQIRKDDRVMVVEGYFDVVRLVSAGFDWVVAPLGTALTDEQAALLRKYTKNAFLLYDSDRAGLKATFRSGDQLLRHGMSVQVVTLPEGEDPDSFVDKQGGAALREQLAHAINVFERKVQLLQRAGWFADLTTKRRALDRLLPTIRATTDPLMRDIYLSRTAEVAGVAKEILEREAEALPAANEMRGTARAAAPRAEQRANAPVPSMRSRGAARSSARVPASERDLVWILLHDRGQVEAAGEQVGPDDLSDPALRDILRVLLAADPSVPSSELAAELVPESVPLFQDLLERPLMDGIDTGSLMSGCIAHIRAALIERRLDEIDGEIRIASPEEQDALLAEKQRLHREVVALGVRRYKSFAR